MTTQPNDNQPSREAVEAVCRAMGWKTYSAPAFSPGKIMIEAPFGCVFWDSPTHSRAFEAWMVALRATRFLYQEASGRIDDNEFAGWLMTAPERERWEAAGKVFLDLKEDFDG
jgi:hypothetical protein